MINLAADYFLLVFFATVGLLQIVAAWSGLKGLLFVPNARVGYAVGVLLLAGAFAWFVLTGDYKIPGDLGGVQGSQQFGLFLAGISAGTIVTVLGASLAQWRHRRADADGPGVEAFRRGTLLAAISTRRRGRGRD